MFEEVTEMIDYRKDFHAMASTRKVSELIKRMKIPYDSLVLKSRKELSIFTRNFGYRVCEDTYNEFMKVINNEISIDEVEEEPF